MKIFKIIIINLVIFFIIFISVETYYAKKWKVSSFKQYANVIFNTISVDEYYEKLFKNQYIEENNASINSFRSDMNTDSTLKPILFMGCSFTYGDGIEQNETISYRTAILTGRPTYNRAGRGWGLGQFLYMARNNYIYNNIPEPEYLVYLYIDDHMNRLDRFKVEPGCIDFQPKYKVFKNGLIEEKPHFYDRIFFIADFQYNYNFRFHKITDEIVKLYFNEAEKEIHKHWKNTKLVILIYPIERDEDQNNRELWKELKKENYYKIINIKDLTDIDLTSDKYKVDGWHPSAKVWDIIYPDIIKKILE